MTAWSSILDGGSVIPLPPPYPTRPDPTDFTLPTYLSLSYLSLTPTYTHPLHLSLDTNAANVLVVMTSFCFPPHLSHPGTPGVLDEYMICFQSGRQSNSDGARVLFATCWAAAWPEVMIPPPPKPLLYTTGSSDGLLCNFTTFVFFSFFSWLHFPWLSFWRHCAVFNTREG